MNDWVIFLKCAVYLFAKNVAFSTQLCGEYQLIILVEISPSFQYHSSRMDERDISLKLPGTNLAPNALGTVS